MERMVESVEIIAPSEVYEEIKIGQDGIYKWCRSNRKMFRDVDECQRQKIKDIEKQYDKDYWKNEIDKMRWADPWIIAFQVI